MANSEETERDSDIQGKPMSEKELHHKLSLLLHTGCLLMKNAADTVRIFRNMHRVAVFLGIPLENLHIFINYNVLMVNFSDRWHSYTRFEKVNKHGINMSTLESVSHLSWK